MAENDSVVSPVKLEDISGDYPGEILCGDGTIINVDCTGRYESVTDPNGNPVPSELWEQIDWMSGVSNLHPTPDSLPPAIHAFMEKVTPALQQLGEKLSNIANKFVDFVKGMRLIEYSHAGISGYVIVRRSETKAVVVVLYPAYSALPDVNSTDYGKFVGNICNERFLKDLIKHRISKKCMRQIKSISFEEPIATPTDWRNAVATFNIFQGSKR